MAATRAADDFTNIRARMDELRRERMPVTGEHAVEADEDHRASSGSRGRVFGLMDRRGTVEVIVVEL
jgi:hypothetical protein